MPHFQDMTPASKAYELAQINAPSFPLGNMDSTKTTVENDGTYVRDSQVKGRVLTSRGPLATGGFFVKQEIDGVTTAYQTYEVVLQSAEDFATLRSHARRNLHEFLYDIRPEA